MAFTFNIAIGICAGFVLYPICKLVAGKSARTEARPVGADRAVAAVLCLLSVRIITRGFVAGDALRLSNYFVFDFPPEGGTTRRLLVT